MTKQKVKAPPEQAKPVELTEAERDRIEAYKAKLKSTPSSALWKDGGGEKGKSLISIDGTKGSEHFLAGLWAATGTVNADLASNLVNRASNATFQPFDEPAQHYNIVTTMAGIAPKDELEGLLIAQMVGAHSMAMECLRRANLEKQTFDGRKLNLAFADRFMRTFAVQVETLSRHRKGGQQKVTVEHVHIYPGAKAAVGIFNQSSEGTGGRRDGHGNSGTTSCTGLLESREPGTAVELRKREKVLCENPEKEEMVILNPADSRALIDASASQKDRVLFMAAILTGMREGELLGLKWDDFDWRNGQIYVRRTYNHGRFYEPKTKSSRRKIDLPPALMQELKRWKIACPVGELDLVFPTEIGTPERAANMFYRRFLSALRRAGLPRTHFHNLRHTYASLLIEQGEHPKYIQSQMGHSSINVTMDTYGHLMNTINRDAAARLGEQVLGSDFRASGSRMVAENMKGVKE